MSKATQTYYWENISPIVIKHALLSICVTIFAFLIMKIIHHLACCNPKLWWPKSVKHINKPKVQQHMRKHSTNKKTQQKQIHNSKSKNTIKNQTDMHCTQSAKSMCCKMEIFWVVCLFIYLFFWGFVFLFVNMFCTYRPPY